MPMLGAELGVVNAARVEARSMSTSRDLDGPALEIALAREPLPAFVEQRHEAFRDVAEADEREVRAGVRHRHSLWHTEPEYFGPVVCLRSLVTVILCALTTGDGCR